jgi:ankyrin repeat protein
MRAPLNNANILRQLLKVGFRNYNLEDLRFFTEKGADIFVRDTTNNSAVHFPAVAFGVDIIKLLLGKRTAVKLTILNNENLQHISAGCDNLEVRKSFVERCCFV